MRTHSAPSQPATKLTTNARRKLKMALRGHPDVAKHVRRLSDISKMKTQKLFDLANQLGMNIQKVIAVDHVRPRMNKDAGFYGALDFDLEISLMGRTIKRAARLVYEYTPEWEHYDLETKSLMPPHGSWITHIEILAIPEQEYIETGPSGRLRRVVHEPTWVLVNLNSEGVLTAEIEDAFDEEIDKRCREEDLARRRAAGLLID